MYVGKWKVLFDIKYYFIEILQFWCNFFYRIVWKNISKEIIQAFTKNFPRKILQFVKSLRH